MERLDTSLIVVIIAASARGAGKAKNVVLFLGDAAGISTWNAASIQAYRPGADHVHRFLVNQNLFRIMPAAYGWEPQPATDATPNAPAFPQQLFGAELYEIYYRFLETEDEYFPYTPARVPPPGRWNISGLGLPDPVLRKVYRANVSRLLGLAA
jgi:hypothetical protein